MILFLDMVDLRLRMYKNSDLELLRTSIEAWNDGYCDDDPPNLQYADLSADSGAKT
jgi:hypothetical protein